MTPALKGAIAGAVIGFGGFVMLRRVAGSQDGPNATPEQKRMADLLRKAAIVDLLIFALAGYLIGPYAMR
jgi:hypothetical protein